MGPHAQPALLYVFFPSLRSRHPVALHLVLQLLLKLVARLAGRAREPWVVLHGLRHVGAQLPQLARRGGERVLGVGGGAAGRVLSVAQRGGDLGAEGRALRSALGGADSLVRLAL